MTLTLQFTFFCNILIYVIDVKIIWMALCSDLNILQLGTQADLVFLELCFSF